MRYAKRGAPAAAENVNVPAPLSELRRPASELAALRTQGVIVARPRGRNREAYFLRFHMGGREKTCYLGVDRVRALAISAALEQWQQPHRVARKLERMRSEAGQLLRSAKAALSGAMQGSRFHFHGRTIRQRRRH